MLSMYYFNSRANTHFPGGMPQSPESDWRLRNVGRSTKTGPAAPLSHGHFSLPPVYYEEPRRLRRKKLTRSNHERNFNSYSLEESSDEEAPSRKRSVPTDCPGWSLDESDSPKSVWRKDLCLHQPQHWVRSCHVSSPRFSSRSSRVRLIVAEETTTSYNHLFSHDNAPEPYDPVTYEDNPYLMIPKQRRTWWRKPSLDRISESSQTSITGLSGSCYVR